MFENKRVVIIGGSSGIGLSLSSKLLDLGASVVIASRSFEKLVKAKDELGGRVSVFRLDVKSEDSIEKFFGRIGAFDYLISTIKADNVQGEFKSNSIESVQQAFNTKFWGQYNLVRHGLKHLHPRGGVVLTSGIESRKAFKGHSTAAIINGATGALVKSLAPELSPIRINAVSPGFIERHQDDYERQKNAAELGFRPAVQRLGTTEEIIDAYLFLMRSTYSTGTTLAVDGGEG